MKIDKKMQANALSKVQQLLQKSEEERKQRRLERGISDFSTGKHEMLHNDELAIQLPAYIINLFQTGEDEEAITVLRVLGESVIGEDVMLRKRAVMVLSLFAEELFASENQEYLLFFTGLLVEWLSRETEFIAGYEVIGRQIERAGTWLMENRYWQETEYLLATLYNIQTGVIEKNDFIKNTTAKIQDNLGTKKNLEKLFTDYMTGSEEDRQSLEQLFFYLNKHFVHFAFTKLDNGCEEKERNALVVLISQLGGSVTPILRDQLQDNPTATVVHNAIEIITRLGDSSNYPLIERFLTHPDLAVRREVVECITNLGGDSVTARLLRALQQADDTLKIMIIRKLVRTDNNEAESILHEQCSQILSQKKINNIILLNTLIVALRKYPSAKSIEILQHLKSRFPDLMKDGRFRLQVEETLRSMESYIRHETHIEKSKGPDVSFHEDPIEDFLSQKKTQGFEQELKVLIGENRIDDASSKLLSRAIEAAREKDFITAERMRDRILEIHPQAYSKVLEAEEVIIEEKKTSVPRSFLDLWEGLRGVMDDREIESLYRGLKIAKYRDEEIIVREGEMDDRMYFINSGTVSMSCSTGSRDVFLKRLKQGEFFGVEQFFSVSVWTVTVATQSDVDLYVLSRREFQGILEDNPAMLQKLETFCSNARRVHELIDMAGEERRNSPRYNIHAKQKIMLLDSYGTVETRSLTSELNDVSEGGFCFTIKIANSENARLLLGRHIKTEFRLSGGKAMACEGLVVGVQQYQRKNKEFRVHIKLLESVATEKIQEVVELLEA